MMKRRERTSAEKERSEQRMVEEISGGMEEERKERMVIEKKR